MAALERGVAVVSEKPMAATMAEARDDGRRRRPRRAAVHGQPEPALQAELAAFRETVARLGPLSSLTCDFYRAHRDAAAEFLFSFPQPLLLDMAIHLFDGARALSGADPLSVYCESFDPPGTWYDGPAAANAVFRMTGDVRFAFNGNWAATGSRRRGRAPGARSGSSAARPGTARARRAWSRPTASARGGRAGAEVERGRFGQLEESLADFVAALRTGRVPLGECHDNIRSLAMCHAAVESAALGAPVPVTA